jgi:Tol biopolymer transport system component/imidazolonepropionase-like amidohydrolase
LSKAAPVLTSVLAFTLASGAAVQAADKKEPPKKKDVAAEINTPRTDARKVSLDLTEGTWMSVDVSPDGRTVLFDLLGDIFAVPATGGAAKALTTGTAWDSQPRFSPDGRVIAFTSDRGGIENLWLMGADGKDPRALTEEKDSYVRSAAWTPDGMYVVARKEDGKRAGLPPVELWMYHREGGSGVKLTSSDEMNNAAGPAPSRDGRWIYFSGRKGPFNYIPNLSQGLWQVFRYDRTTGETFPVTEGFGGGARPLPSPDGKTLAYVSRRDNDTVIVLRDLATGRETIAVRGVTRDEQEGFGQMDVWPGYAFTPDGQALLYSSHGRIRRLDVAGRQDREVPFRARVDLALAPRVAWQDKVPAGPVEARILRWAGQSNDGRLIVFDAFGRVWLQDVAAGRASGAPRRLTSGASGQPTREYSPALSPDGQWLAYVTWSDQDGGHVWKAPVAGGVPQKLTRTAGHYANPTWSPRGDRLALIRGSGLEFRGRQPEEESTFEIHWLDAAGGDPQYVTTVSPFTATSFHPRAYWSADAGRLLFREPVPQKKPTDDPKSELVSVRLDGTDKKRHLRLPQVPELVPSPDGRWVAFTSRDNVYVAALPDTLTKEPPDVSPKEGAVPVWRLSNEAGVHVGWTDSGKTLTWALGPTFYRLPLASAIQFAQEEKKKAAEKDKAKQPLNPKRAGDTDAKKDAAKADAKKDDEDELKLPKAETIALKLSLPRAAPQGSFVLKGARVVTMKGDEVLPRADVLVTGNRIAAVGASGSVTVPAGARELDGAGKTVIPGLIDSHAHLHYSAFETFPETKWEYAANLAYGVTTVYDPSAPSLDVFAQAEMVEAGLMEGPRVFSSGDVLYGGQPFDIYAEVNSQADAVRQVRRMKAYGARMIKVYQQPRRSQRLYFAEAARQEHMLLTAEGAGELQTDLTMAMDGFTAFEHSLPVALHADVVQLVARSGTHYTPTLLVSYGGPWGELFFWQTRNPHDDPKLGRFTPHFALDGLGRRHPWIWPDEYHFPTVAEGVAKVVRAGGNASLGAHGQLQGLGVHWELWAMAGEGGAGKALTPHEALRAATLAAADKIGYAPELGSIEAGKMADLVVLDADPLVDIHNTEKIRWVVKNGVVYEGESLRQVWPQERDLPRQYWQQQVATAPGGAVRSAAPAAP